MKFLGTGTVTISDSSNVSSITDNTTGDYTVNFTGGTFSNANYACVFGGQRTSSNDNGYIMVKSTPTTSACRLLTGVENAFVPLDIDAVYAVFVGGN